MMCLRCEGAMRDREYFWGCLDCDLVFWTQKDVGGFKANTWYSESLKIKNISTEDFERFLKLEAFQ